MHHKNYVKFIKSLRVLTGFHTLQSFLSLRDTIVLQIVQHMLCSYLRLPKKKIKICNTHIFKVNVSALISSARFIKYSSHNPQYSILCLLLLSYHFLQGVRHRSNQICYINQTNIYNIPFQGCLQPCQIILM